MSIKLRIINVSYSFQHLMQKYVTNHKIKRTSWRKCTRGATFFDTRNTRQLIGVKIESIKSFIKYNLFTDRINKLNFGSHGDLQKQTKTHILALQWAIVFKIYWTHLCLYLDTDWFYSLPATLITFLFQLSGRLYM